MKRIVKIVFKPGEKVQLFNILSRSTTSAGAKLLVQEEMGVDAVTANCAVDRFWKIAKEKTNTP